MRKDSAESAYGSRRAESWSRIDMLLALYQSGMGSLSRAIDATRKGKTLKANRHRLKAMGVVQGILAGLDLDDSDVVVSIARLCEFMSYAIQDGSLEKLEDAHMILTTLHDGFSSIRSEAIALEKDGVIPSLDAKSFQLTV